MTKTKIMMPIMTTMKRMMTSAALMMMAAAVMTKIIATFRLEYEDDCEYEFQVLSTRTSKGFALQT